MRWLAPRRAHLSDEQRVTVQQAIDRLRSEWRNDPQDHATEALRAFIAEHILDAGRFDVAAREVLTCQEIVDRLKPKRMLIDALENPTTRILCALAHQNEIPVDYTWHGVYIQALKSDLLGSDPREPAYVSRSLTWGEHNEWWLRAIGSPVEMKRIGHPYASKLRKKIRVQCWDRALVLQGAPGIHDIKGLHHNQYAYFVRIVRALTAQGMKDIRFKLHPGGWRAAYYDRIKGFFNLKCDVVVDGPFEDHVAWSDFVIGPTGSGAMAETLALGRPYFPVSLLPNGADSQVVKMFKSYENLDTLLEALENRECPDLMEPAQKLLGDRKFERDDGTMAGCGECRSRLQIVGVGIGGDFRRKSLLSLANGPINLHGPLFAVVNECTLPQVILSALRAGRFM